MNDVDSLTRLHGRALRISEQLEQTHAPLEFKSTLVVYGADDFHLLRVVFLYEDVHLQVLVIPGITARDIARQLAFSTTSSLNLSINQRHADHAIAFHSHRIAREVGSIEDAYV